MKRKRKRISDRVGLPPGSLVYTGEPREDDLRITYIRYDKDTFEESELRIEECPFLKDDSLITWIDVPGVYRTEPLEMLGRRLDIHPLILEDIISTHQRPKIEDHGRYLFIRLKYIDHDEKQEEVLSEQVSLILGPNYLISFQEIGRNLFAPIAERLRSRKGHLRTAGADYLAYSILDLVVDTYFDTLEKVGYSIEDLEEELVSRPDQTLLQLIHHLRREMILFRRATWPLREIITSLEKREFQLIRDDTAIYLRDLYDHTFQIIDIVETYRDMLSGMIDIYLSSVSNRLNSVMKVLTVIATIFMPLTFIAGVYGMNFKYMPELEYHWGYPVVMLIMLLIAGVMLFYFKVKQWI